MKLPRDLDGTELVKSLARLGYFPSRQSGSHIRLHCDEPQHAITIPNHRPLKIGTLASILADLERCHGLTRSQLLNRLFDFSQ